MIVFKWEIIYEDETTNTANLSICYPKLINCNVLASICDCTCSCGVSLHPCPNFNAFRAKLPVKLWHPLMNTSINFFRCDYVSMPLTQCWFCKSQSVKVAAVYIINLDKNWLGSWVIECLNSKAKTYKEKSHSVLDCFGKVIYSHSKYNTERLIGQNKSRENWPILNAWSFIQLNHSFQTTTWMDERK